MARILDFIFCLYFFSHIPITIFVDSQALFPKWMYPQVVLDTFQWYTQEFRDPIMAAPPAWFKSFIYCEVFLQFPFFFVASYAFYKGGCKWIRIPALVYASHVATTLLPIINHVWMEDFSASPFPGPRTTEERLKLIAIYSPYLLVPVLLLFKMLFGSEYQEKVKRT